MSKRGSTAGNAVRGVAERRNGDPRISSRRGPEPSPTELPLELTSFVGRERELAEVEALLAKTRLLTLTGPGGSGKTRLARQAAARLAAGFEGGARWVELAALLDRDLVSGRVASALGVREAPGRSITALLVEHLESGEMLLALDNCEHVIEGCAELADILLRACPNLCLLATSREPLGVAGEVSWSVPPLSLPDPEHEQPPEELLRCESVRLFAERAAAAAPGFAATAENAPTVARICERLDGMPLAIELAASRARFLSPRQTLARLDDRFRLLTGGGRTSVPRHKTLRATIDWSHDLLSEEERALFRRLSAFAGGFTLEAAEAVCAGDGIEKREVFDLLSQLVDKSLVTVGERGDGEVRYRLLETVRQYGGEKLEESGEEAEVRHRHADFFLKLAEEAEPAMTGSEQVTWMQRLEREHDNLRAALGWLEEEGEAERGLRLAGALLRFWWFRGHLTEGRARLEALLGLRGAPVREGVQARALHTLGVLIYRHADYAAGDWAAARSRLEESLVIYRRLGDEPRIAAVLPDLGRVGAELGEWTAARSFLDESLAIGRRSGNKHGIALSLIALGLMRSLRGERSSARVHLEESLAIFQELDDKFWIGACLVYLGYADCGEGDYAAARSRFVEANETAPLLQLPWGATYVLEGFTRLAAAQGQAARALRLGGATIALRGTFGVTIGPAWQAAFRLSLEPAWQALNAEEAKATWEEGRTMTLEAALALALEEPATLRLEEETKPDHPAGGGLSARELEVLSLVAEGLTDAQVAGRLHLSPRTIGQHLRSVYNKLGVPSRTAATREAMERGLI